MSVPVTNQPYSQQNNQLFEWAKTATGPQIEAAKNGLPKDSPLLLAIGMGVQYQQQARAPHPQAPQKTVMEQKLGEFAQTSAQGLPSVGGNQMAMQQAVQQDPMRNAGIGIAQENSPNPQQAPQQQAPQPQAPQPQGQAATGGLVALAHGGEVRRFETGGGANVLGGLTSINLGGDPSLPYGQYEAPTLGAPISDMGIPTTGGTNPKIKSTLSDFEEAPKAKPKVKAHHSKKDTAPAPGSSAEANAASPTAKGETYQGLKEYLSKGEVDPNAYGADSAVSSMLNKDTTPHLTAEESIAQYQKLLGPEADMSEEVAMAKEAARGANKEKWGAALTQGIGAYLSDPTQYTSRALGAGLMSGVSGYQQGAKEEQAANKDLMALQMASKKSDLAGHRAAAEAYIGQQAKMAEKAEEARARIHELQMTQGSAAKVAGINAASAANVANINAASAQTRQALENMSAMELKQFEAGTLSMDKIADIVGRSAQGGNSPEDTQKIVQEFMAFMGQNKGRGGASGGGSSQPLNPLKNNMFLQKKQ